MGFSRTAEQQARGKNVDVTTVRLGTRDAHRNHNCHGSHQHSTIRFQEGFSSRCYAFLPLIRNVHRRFALHEPAFGATHPPSLSHRRGATGEPGGHRSPCRAYLIGGVIRNGFRPDLLGIARSQPHHRGGNECLGWERRSFVHSALAAAREFEVADSFFDGEGSREQQLIRSETLPKSSACRATTPGNCRLPIDS
jgi:hypothetical protein